MYVLQSHFQLNFFIFLFRSTALGTCICDDCKVEIFPNFYVMNKKKFLTTESIRNDSYVYLSGNQAFDQNLLIDFDQQLIHNTVSFEGYANAYNSKVSVITGRGNQSCASIPKIDNAV